MTLTRIDILEGRQYTFYYTNHRDELSVRWTKFISFQFGIVVPYYPEPTLLLRMFDLDKNAERSFAARSIDWSTWEFLT